MDYNDQELIVAVKRGDQESARILYERYHSMAVKISFRILRSLDDALDIAQDVFIIILGKRKIMYFRGESQFSTWLYKVTRNQCLSWLRKKRKMITLSQTAVSDYLFDRSSTDNRLDPYFQLEGSENKEIVYKILETLPAVYSRCLYLRYFKGHKYREIAEKLNISSDQVGMIIFRSLRTLSKKNQLKALYRA